MRSIFRGPPKVEAPMSINDVESGINLKLSQRTRISLRESVEIAVIDDQPFEPATNLKNNHYKVQHFHDIDNISVLDQYPIILSDLQGVGVHLHPDLQGAHLIRELKAQSPEKVVIAYSGIGRNAIMSRTAVAHADRFVRKDADIDEWIEALDAAVAAVSNPVRQWKQFRTRMLNAGMTPAQLTALEDAFARSIWDGKEKTEEALQTKAEIIGLQQDLRAILQSFVAALIFKALVG